MGDIRRCWTAFCYTKPWMFFTPPALKDMEGNQAITLEDKEEIARKVSFLRPPNNPVGPTTPRPGTQHQDIETAAVCQALYNQV